MRTTRQKNLSTLKIAVAAAVTTLLSPPVLAADADWIGPDGGYWDEPANWSAGWPWQDDTAIFDQGDNSYTVNYFNQGINDSIGKINVISDDVTLDLNQVLLSINPALGGQLNVGDYNNSPSLTLLNGELAVREINLDGPENGTSNLTVSTGASIIGVDNSWVVDNSYAPAINIYEGTLNVVNGGLVNSSRINGAGSAGTVAINVAGAGSQINNSGAIDLASWAPMTVSAGGGVTTQDLNLQYSVAAGYANGISVDGQNSSLNITNKLALGRGDEYDNGFTPVPVQMNVTNGARVTVNDADIGDLGSDDEGRGPRGAAELIIDGTQGGNSSTFISNGRLQISGGSDSQLTVRNGGTLTTNGDTFVGSEDGTGEGLGTLTITGANSSWNGTNSYVSVGGAGEGIVNILDGATSSATEIFIAGGGQSAINSGAVNVDGIGSTIAMNKIYIAHEGPDDQSFTETGSLNITNGAQVVTDDVYMANGNRGGDARMRIAGDGSELRINGNLNSLEATGNVQIDVAANGLLSATGNLNFGGEYSDSSDAVASVNVSTGGRVEANTINVGSDHYQVTTNATFNITAGGEVAANEIAIHAGSTLNITDTTIGSGANSSDISVWPDGKLVLINGAINSSVEIGGGELNADGFIADLLLADGTLNIGQSPGHLTTDNFSVFHPYAGAPGGTVVFELAGYEQGVSYDYLEIIEGLTLDNKGTLEIALLDGFDPLMGTSFELITAGNEGYGEPGENVFANLILPELDGTRYFEIEYGNEGSQWVKINVVPIPAAVWLFGSGLAMLGFWRRRGVSQG